MEVRVRSGFEESRFEAVATEAETSKYVKMDNHDLKNQKNPRLWRKVKHEVTEIGRVTLNMLKGQGSKFSYLFIPAFISLLWLVICFITTRNPNVTLEEQYIRVRLSTTVHFYIPSDAITLEILSRSQVSWALFTYHFVFTFNEWMDFASW